MLRVFVLVLLAHISNAWHPSGCRFFVKKVATAALCIGLSGLAPDTSIAAANPALEAATRAMLEKKEKKVDERDFSSLPDATKKRRALLACKGPTAKAFGFNSQAACNEAVFKGDYTVADPLAVPAAPVPTTAAPKSRLEATTDSTPTSTVSRGLTVDVSDLTPAALKRKSLALCKKAEVRKLANIRTESSCTESIMKGDFSKIIPALEAGY